MYRAFIVLILIAALVVVWDPGGVASNARADLGSFFSDDNSVSVPRRTVHLPPVGGDAGPKKTVRIPVK